MNRFGFCISCFCTAVAMLVLAAGCKHAEERTPPAGVWIVFATQDQWTTYGTPGALDTKVFIKSEGIPRNFPYAASSQTGFGGVLLVGDTHGNPAAYDLSCPVENRADIRVSVDMEHLDAVCRNCGSRYWIFSNYGKPESGKAADLGYELKKYTIAAGPNGEYRVIRP